MSANKAGSKQSSLLGFFSKVGPTQTKAAGDSPRNAGSNAGSNAGGSVKSAPAPRTSPPKGTSAIPKATLPSAVPIESLPLETPPPSERRSSSKGQSAPNSTAEPASQPTSSPTYARSSSRSTGSLVPPKKPSLPKTSGDSDDLTPPPSSEDSMDVDDEDDQPLFRRRAAVKRSVNYAESDSDGAQAISSDSDDDAAPRARKTKSGKGFSKRARTARDEDDFIVPDDVDNVSDVVSEAGAVSEDDAGSQVENMDDSDDEPRPKTSKKAKSKVPPAAPTPARSSSNSALSAFKMASGSSRSPSTQLATSTTSPTPRPSTSHLTKAERRIIEEKRKRADNEQAYSFLVDLRDKDGNRPGDTEYDSRTVYIPKTAWKDFTPFEEQFWRIKQNHWDTVLFFQKGKFYELYEEDALIGHREFDLKLTDRVKMKMVGVPESSFEIFAAKFLALGYKVGRVDQTETAVAKGMRVGERSRGGGSEIVNRELRHVLTSGTIVDASSLPDDLNNFCISIKEDLEGGRNGPIFGICTLDASTAEFNLTEFEDDESRTRLETLLRSLRLKEVLHEKGGLSGPTLRVLRGTVPSSAQTTMLKPSAEFLDHETTLRKLNALFNPDVDADAPIDSLDQVDPQLLPEGIASMVEKANAMSALGGMLFYLTQLNLDRDLCSSRNFNIFDPLRQDKCLVLDAQSLTHLNILQNDEGTDEGTLHRLLNRCVTPFGKRLFKIWLVAPLAAIDAIRARQDAVEDLMAHTAFGDEFDTFGKSLPDIERIIPRIHAGKCRPRDFTTVLKALVKFQRASSQLQGLCDGFATDVISGLLTSMPAVGPIARELQSTFVIAEDGSFTPIEGVFEPFDRAVTAIDEVEAQLESELESYRKQLKLNAAKCCWKHLGSKDIFAIEVPSATKVPPNWIKLSGTKDRNRFYSPKVRELVQDIKEARETRLAALKQFHKTLFERFSEQSGLFLQAIKTVAEIDCLLSLAKASNAMGEPACRPELVESETALVEFEHLRHPCIAGENVDFIPNDIRLGGESDEVVILTGGNMAGKSTTARTSATGVILAQLGCRVPATSARISPCDRIASRMGANDQIFRNNSTFMVEMLEASRIINECTPRSLVIMDELGRGTSTFDGQAIAYAVLHHLVSRTRCLTFFLTHYTNLAYDFNAYSRVSNKHMQVMVDDDKREVIFTYRLIDGIAESSYGTQVAALAGVPHDICDRAASVSKQFADATKATQAEKNRGAIPLASMSDFVHLFRMSQTSLPDASDKNAKSKTLTMASQLDIIRSQVASVASEGTSLLHIEQDESADDVSSIPATSTPARSGAKITTTYGGRARRAMTEDALFSPRAGDTRSDDETRSRSSPVLSSTPLLFPKMHAKPTPRKSQPKTMRPKESEQLILDLGQKIRIKCAGCEMQYDTSCAEDCALHAKYHERTVKGIDWSSKALSLHGEAVAEIDIRPSPSVLRAKPNNFGSGKAGESKTATILRYDMGSMKDAVANRKITELLTAVDEALGAAAVEAAVIKTCKVFVAVCGGRAVGAALVGRIASGTARQVISRSGEDKENHNETGMLWDDAGDAIFVSEALSDAQTPPVGIYRIHTIPGCRRSGIASELLDAAANHSIYGLTLNKLIGTYGSRAKAVAFSQPTEAGRKLAEAWIRKGVSQDESPRLVVFEA